LWGKDRRERMKGNKISGTPDPVHGNNRHIQDKTAEAISLPLSQAEPEYCPDNDGNSPEAEKKTSNKEPYTLAIILDSIRPGVIQNIYLYDPEGYEDRTGTEGNTLRLSIYNHRDRFRKETYIESYSPVINYKPVLCKIIVYNAADFYNTEYQESIENTIMDKGKIVYDSKYVTQPANIFFSDVEGLYRFLVNQANKNEDVEIIKSNLCLYAKNVAKNLLQGYILHKKYNLKHKTRNLVKLWEIAAGIDGSFNTIQKECAILSRYTEIMSYSDSYIPVTVQDYRDAVNALKIICEFMPIKELRDFYREENL
jgi:hypothetical protein